MYLANKTGDENRKAFISKGNLSTLIRWDWGGYQNDGCSRHRDRIGSVYIPHKNFPAIWTHSNTAGEKSPQDANNWQSAKWRRNKIVWFPARLKLRPSTSSFVAKVILLTTNSTKCLRLLLRCFIRRSEGCVLTRPQFPCDYLVWWSCVVICARWEYSKVGNVHKSQTTALRTDSIQNTIWEFH